MKNPVRQKTIDLINLTMEEFEKDGISFEEMKRVVIADLHQRIQHLMDEYEKATGVKFVPEEDK